MRFRVTFVSVLAACLLASAPAGADILDSLRAVPTLDLPLLERAVIARNPSLAAGKAAWREMEARADAAGALDDPMLDLMAAPQSFGRSSVDEAYSIGLSQRLPIFGQRGLMGRAARSTARAAQEDYRTTGQDLIHEARRLYFEYYAAARGAEVNR
ncbi:MAG TPA: TolC family protein, partial [Candidatus Eisenbacteria bacterium]